jgi:hypothetical protein
VTLGDSGTEFRQIGGDTIGRGRSRRDPVQHGERRPAFALRHGQVALVADKIEGEDCSMLV